MDTTSDGLGSQRANDGSVCNLAVTTEYNNVYGEAERSCCDDDIVILICSVDITSPNVTGLLVKARRSWRILDEGYGQLIEY